MKAIYEKAFILLSPFTAIPSREGREQFCKQQSRGIVPVRPDPYYYVLCEGKTAMDFLVTEYRQMWIKGEWWGFNQLRLDWTGNRWILPLLCKWWPDELPIWLTQEEL